MSNKTKIIIGVVALVMLGIVGIAVTQGIRYAHLNNELKRMNEDRIETIEALRQEKVRNAEVYMDSLRYWKKQASISRDSIVIIDNTIEQIQKDHDKIILPSTPDDRVDELKRIGADYGIHNREE